MAKDRPLRGSILLPGDKSISHRALILAAVAEGRSRIVGLNRGEDVCATARALDALGALCRVDVHNATAEVEGSGWAGLREPDDVIDVGNSGTSLRLLAGVCAALPGMTVLTGDATLRRRPMKRVVAPLRAMGARIDGRSDGDRAPVVIRGDRLRGIRWRSEVASAQVKSAVLVAGLAATGSTTIEEPAPSRDHTERMLAARGVEVVRSGTGATVRGGQQPRPGEHAIPGDLSSALYPLVGAALVPGSDLIAQDVGVNPTRAGALEVLRTMGADVEVEVTGELSGEPVGRVRVRSQRDRLPLRAASVSGGDVPRLIDEIPALCIAACAARGRTVIRDAVELRAKESDRIATMAAGINALGGNAHPLTDGLVITGPATLHDGHIDARGDHRIALAFAVAGIVWDLDLSIAGWEAVKTSFPEFDDVMAAARGGQR
jgi:3-phosphoshikimate 1-carboxyvinyltransferase